jgi:ribonuclease HII
MADEQTIVGIDEAGRGPLAGPVYVGLVAAPTDFDFDQFPVLADSKQMTESDRKEIYEQIIGGDYVKIDYAIRYSTPHFIDKQGINPAIRQAINRGMRNLDLPTGNTKILLDGGLSAPSKYTQKTITKGDQKEPAISLASVLAKVARDRYMKSIDEQHDFDFASHKGYGTRKHRKQVDEVGPTSIHRKTFL